ncbi:hypothetical protein KDK_80900 [Dictyobacter kobayashii]|uniref:ATP-grasp domain-containing protein n=1 Tax=Dictyobacter kobayashii TaxID=2014872 RepID=A0A402AYV9_9CHLR|nr:hypothetical protein KDK_80900 [Dictyobacter kobayashii]
MTWYTGYRQRTAYNLPPPAVKCPYYAANQAAVMELYQEARATGCKTLPLLSVDALAHRYHIPVSEAHVFQSVDDLVMHVRSSLGYPCVLKISSPSLLHKSDVGGVIVNIKDEVALLEAHVKLEELIAAHRLFDATIAVQKYIAPGVPLIVGPRVMRISATSCSLVAVASMPSS